MDIVFIVARIIFGLFFLQFGLMHFMKWNNMMGYAKSKNLPMPAVAVALTGLMLIAGGLGFILWKFVCIAAIILVGFLVPTAFIMHKFWKVEDEQMKMNEMIHFLNNIALAAAAALAAAMYYGVGVM